MGGSLLELTRLTDLANMPSKEEAIAQFAAILKAPITKFCNLVIEIPTKFVRTLDAINQQKQQAKS